MFSQACIIPSVHGGGERAWQRVGMYGEVCVWQAGVHGGGGGLCGGGHAWQGGVCNG